MCAAPLGGATEALEVASELTGHFDAAQVRVRVLAQPLLRATHG